MSAGLRPQWLTSRPIAHRGLHDVSSGAIENSPSAARAAIEAGYAIECDVQISRDGEAMVFHDYALERLTARAGRVDSLDAADLRGIELPGSRDRVPTLPGFLAAIAGRTPLVCEIKSRFDGDVRLAERVAACARDYAGPLAIKSFDPEIMAFLRANRARLGLSSTPLGVVAQADYDDPGDEWAGLSPERRRALSQFLHWPETRPDFLSWSARDLPAATPLLCRRALGLPVITWTIRSPSQWEAARDWADQMVFERFPP